MNNKQNVKEEYAFQSFYFTNSHISFFKPFFYSRKIIEITLESEDTKTVIEAHRRK